MPAATPIGARAASLLALFDRVARTDFRRSLRMAQRLAPELATGAARLRVLLAGLLFGTLRWRRPIALAVEAPDGRVRFVLPDYAAFQVMFETFVVREYDVEPPAPPRAILDLGAHVGASVLFFRRKWPSARIVAVEPSPDLAPTLRANMASLGVDVRAVAVAAKAGEATFYPAPDSWAGTTLAGEGTPVRVPAVALDDLLDDDVDLVKIDVEGEEFNVIPASRRLVEVPTIVGEVHAPRGSPACEELLSRLEGFSIEEVGPGEKAFTAFRATAAPRPRLGCR